MKVGDAGIIDVTYISNVAARCATGDARPIMQFIFNNTSACSIGDGRRILAIKTFYNNVSVEKEHVDTEESFDHEYVRYTKGTYGVIPGNGEECGKLNVGKNFPWNRWNSMDVESPQGKTLFFLYEEEGDHLSRIKLVRRSDPDTEMNIIKMGDVRILRIDEQSVLLINGDLANLIICSLDGVDEGKLFASHYIDTGLECKNCSIVKFNHRMVKNELHVSMLYMDWFYEDGVRLINKEFRILERGFGRRVNEPDKKIVIRYDESHGNLSGKGSYHSCVEDEKRKFGRHYGKAPGFSFSTPLHKIGEDEDYESFLGVGHSKIRNGSRYPYLPGSNIARAKEFIHEILGKKFGFDYKIHHGSTLREGGMRDSCMGYIYLMYFYIVRIPKMDGLEYEMSISDSFLPIDTRNHGYKFSLIFPMGLILHDTTIVVTAGEGDFRSVMMNFNRERVIKLAEKHNIKRLDLDNYEFNLIFIDEEVPGRTLVPYLEDAVYQLEGCEYGVSGFPGEQSLMEGEGDDEGQGEGGEIKGGGDVYKYLKYKFRYEKLKKNVHRSSS